MPVFAQVDYLWDVVYEGRKHDKEYMMKAFVEFEEQVKTTIPKNDLLVYPIGAGWEPLCQFLGVPVPDVPFPHTNKQNRFEHNLNMIRNGEVPELK